MFSRGSRIEKIIVGPGLNYSLRTLEATATIPPRRHSRSCDDAVDTFQWPQQANCSNQKIQKTLLTPVSICLTTKLLALGRSGCSLA